MLSELEVFENKLHTLFITFWDFSQQLIVFATPNEFESSKHFQKSAVLGPE